MAAQYCAKTPDPAKCETQARERVKERVEQRREMRGKDGEKPTPKS
jgi:hypothetical protein